MKIGFGASEVPIGLGGGRWWRITGGTDIRRRGPRALVGVLLAGLAAWTVLDIFFAPVGQVEHDRTAQHVLLGCLWVLMALCAAGARLDLMICESGLMHAMAAYALLVGVHGLVRLAGAWDYATLVTLAKHLFWIVAYVAAVRLQQAGALRARDLNRAAQVAIVCVSTRLIASVFDGTVMEYEATGWAYCVARLLPLLLLVHRPGVVGRVVLVSAVVAVVCTLKRGALVAIVLGQLGFLVAWGHVHPRQRSRAVALGMLIGLAVAGVLAWRWEAFVGRLADLQSLETAGSWRGSFYRIILEQWCRLDTVRQIVGAGFWAVPDLLERVWVRQYAHSDWLEILYDYGLIGVGVFVWLNLAMLGLVCQAWRRRDETLPALVMSVMVFWLGTLYSGFTFWPEMVWFGLLLGYAAGRIEAGQRRWAWRCAT